MHPCCEDFLGRVASRCADGIAVIQVDEANFLPFITWQHTESFEALTDRGMRHRAHITAWQFGFIKERSVQPGHLAILDVIFNRVIPVVNIGQP